MLTVRNSTGGAFIIRMMYGINIQDENDKYMIANEKAMETVVKVSYPFAFAFDVLPIRKYTSS